MDPSLWRLVIKANVSCSAYTRDLFFRGCTYQKGIVWTETEDQAGFIRRCFLEQFKAVASDCDVRVLGPQPVKSSSLKAYKGEAKERQDGFLG